jgi:TatD DNase family protein
MLIDTHAHLSAREFDADRDAVIQRAREAGVAIVINPATNVEDSSRAIDLAERHPGVYACVGIHPHEAAGGTDEALDEIERLSAHPRVVGIGEIGLDYHYDFAPRDVQERVFRAQIKIACRRDLPIVVHTRESMADAIRVVTEETGLHPEWRSHRAFPQSRYPGPRGVFHCFAGTTEEAWVLVRLGFAISFPGILTFKNAGGARAVAGGISLEHLMLETDSPYMTPVPHRGTRNEPVRLPLIAEALAQLQGFSPEDVARSTAYTAHRVFGVGDKPRPRITYTLRESLYVNLTTRCNADCVFCDRKGEAVIKGHNLKIDHEPTAAEVIADIRDPRAYREIVFCGYGEPTIRLEVLKEVARWVKANGGRTRLNTDGHGNVIHRRNIVPELAGLLDSVSVSLNSPDPARYGELMRLDPAVYFPAMIEFAREAVRHIGAVSMTVLDMEGIDHERARELVEKEIGAVFVQRPLF